LLKAQVTTPVKQWDEVYGGNEYDVLRKMLRTQDLGYLLAGESSSPISGEQLEDSRGGGDFWLLKIDATDNKQWSKRYGGNSTEILGAIISTPDGGYLLGGGSESDRSGERSQANRGYYDYWIVKTDANGQKQWDKAFGGSNADVLTAILPTADGGYLLGGRSDSPVSGEMTEASRGESDYWIVKLDKHGNKQWDKRYGGDDNDYLYAMLPTPDGGYVLGGSSASSISGDKTEANRDGFGGGYDYWIVKIDSSGAKQWDRANVGDTTRELTAMLSTEDGGYLVAGNHGSRINDYGIVKLDSTGRKQWEKTYGGDALEQLEAAILTPDGGYLLGGLSHSGISGEKTEEGLGNGDYWVVKLDPQGNQQWDKTYGGGDVEYLFALLPVSTGGYLLGGASASGINGNKTKESRGGYDYWVVKIGSDQVSPTQYRINAGGSKHTTVYHQEYQADGYYQGGIVSTKVTTAVAGTGDDYLYQTGRHGASFSYHLPIQSGEYDVVLHFAETYWGNLALGGVGSRRFNVDIEGERKLTEYDIFQQAQGALRVKQETFRVRVHDDTLSILFSKGSSNLASIKAIEVLPAGSFHRINAGGERVITASNQTFLADTYYAEGVVSTRVTQDIQETEEDALYQSGRHGASFSYGLPTGNGTFDLTLHFCETWWGNIKPGGVGSRRFNVDIEGERKLTEYDIYQKASGALRAVKETFRVTVTDGVLNLYFSKGSADLASIKAIELVPASGTNARLAVQATPSPLLLYPNPVQDKLIVQLAFPANQLKATAVIDSRGTVHLTNAHKLVGENQLEIRVGTLPKGMYFLQVEAQQQTKRNNFIKQ
jgi:hypothetical protein